MRFLAHPYTLAGLIWLAIVAVFLHAQTRLAPDQLKVPRVLVMTCIAPPTPPATNCAGLYYVELTTAAGTQLKLMAEPAIAPLDPAVWSLVP